MVRNNKKTSGIREIRAKNTQHQYLIISHETIRDLQQFGKCNSAHCPNFGFLYRFW